MDEEKKIPETENIPAENGENGAENAPAPAENAPEQKENGAAQNDAEKEAEKAEAMAHRLAQKRRLRYGTFATLITVAVVAAVFVLNVVVSMLKDRYPLSIDLTSTGMYDISDESKAYVKGLTQDVKITVLAKQSSLTSSNEYLTQVDKIIEAYAKNSDRVTLQYVDLTENPTFTANYPDLDLADNDVIVECGGRTKVVSINDMLTYDSSNYYYTGKYTIESSTAEQTMTNAIMYVASGEVSKIQFITGLGETDSADLQKLLTSNSYDVSTLNLLSEDPDPDAAALVWFGPTLDPTEEQLKKLDKYLAEGGNLFVFVDPLTGDQPALDAFLSEWGLEEIKGVAFETDTNYMLNNSPYFPIVQYTDTDFAGSLVGSNSYTAFYRMRPVAAKFETSGYITTDVLLSLSAKSGYHAADVSSDYQIQDSDIKGSVGAMILAKSYDGKVTSNVVLTGSTTAFSGEFLTNTAVSNAEYLVGVFNKLCDRGNMVTIAAKDFSSQSNNMTTAQLTGAIVLFMGVIPLAVLAAGIVIWVRRRRK